ncbi:hypothetical protein ACFYVR_23505 [Rhodococcus sp. NPDC003318]|uniref:hypothetical protein n=1 Tax=Rhodococcus sp. NPDC003318 TaxID=3364503 RepID=UPI0036C433EF
MRPAYGRTPVEHSDGLRWLTEISGDGWAARCWSPRPVTGRVEIDGSFVADLPAGEDDPVPVRGRVRRVRLVRQRTERIPSGVRAVAGSEILTEVDAAPPRDLSVPALQDADEFWCDTGVLIDLDLDDVPVVKPEFRAGWVSVHGSDVWVMDRTDPVLLHVDATSTLPRVTEYLMPLTVEPPSVGYARAVHADADGCWITSVHDVFRCDRDDSTSVSVERVCAEGGRGVLDDGQLYLLRWTEPMMCVDRRHGPIRVDGDAHRVRVLGDDRRLQVVDDPVTIGRVTASVGRPDRARGGDGRQWAVRGALLTARSSDGATREIHLGTREPGTVRWRKSDPMTDPANAGLVPILGIPRQIDDDAGDSPR